jgi:hypothetical protein
MLYALVVSLGCIVGATAMAVYGSSVKAHISAEIARVRAHVTAEVASVKAHAAALRAKL